MHQDNNKYDFIMEKKPLGDGGAFKSSSMRGRILIAAAGALLLLIIGAIVFGLLSKNGDKSSADILTAAQQQNELIRITDIGIKKSRSSATVNFAITTQLSLQTDQRLLVANMKSHKQNTSAQLLGAAKNTKTDNALTVADQNNAFDTAFMTTTQSQLSTYRQTLKRAYDASSDKKTKQLLADCYAHVNTLLQNTSASASQ